MTFSLVSTCAATSSASAQLVKERLAIQTICAASSNAAAWPLMMNTAGDLNSAYPYFDVPAGWPTPVVPGP